MILRFKINFPIFLLLILFFATFVQIAGADSCSTCSGSQVTLTATTLPTAFTRIPTQNFMGYYQRIYKIGLTPTPTVTVPVTPTPTQVADLTTISQGGNVFIGEEGLDISNAIGTSSYIGWYKPGDDPRRMKPSAVINVPDPSYFTIDPSSFSGKTGSWYQMGVDSTSPVVAIIVNDPSLDVKIIDQTGLLDVSGKNIKKSTLLNFKIITNMFQVYRERTVLDGFITITVQGPDNLYIETLVGKDGVVRSLDNVATTQATSYWVSAGSQSAGWDTGHYNEFGFPVYRDGQYKVSAASNLNNMRAVYRDKSGNEYKGKTVTDVRKITLFSLGPTVTPTSTTTKQPNMYTYSGNGWSIQYPVGWIYYGDNIDIYAGTIFQPKTGNVALAVYKGTNSGYDLSTLSNSQIENFANMVVTSLFTNSNFMKVVSSTKTTLGGRPAVFVTLGGTSTSGVTYQMKVYFIIDSGYLYILPYTGETVDYLVNGGTADAMFKTFAIK